MKTITEFNKKIKKQLLKLKQMKKKFKKNEVFFFLNETPSLADYGCEPKRNIVLFPEMDYNLTNLRLKNKYYTFELWDDQGRIGSYRVYKEIFENNAIRECDIEEYFKTNEFNKYKNFVTPVIKNR